MKISHKENIEVTYFLYLHNFLHEQRQGLVYSLCKQPFARSIHSNMFYHQIHKQGHLQLYKLLDILKFKKEYFGLKENLRI